jgi:micrococcal nuclease
MARKPFKAVPLKAVVNAPGGRSGSSPWHGARHPRAKASRVSPIMVMLPLTAFAAVFFYGGGGTPPVEVSHEIAPLADLSEEDLRRRVWPTTPEMVDGAQPKVGGNAVSSTFTGGAVDRESARFTLCNGRSGGTCVIDGDTFWYAGEKIRVADINTPEVSEPRCAREAQLGAAATARLQALLNEGAFTLASVDRDRDAYGRLLRTVTRQGESVGAVLVREGLAEEWRGRRSGWC